MKNEGFYLDNEKFSAKSFSDGQISLPVYQINNKYREEFNLVFSYKDNLIPFL
jgi:hypothetical protein